MQTRRRSILLAQANLTNITNIGVPAGTLRLTGALRVCAEFQLKGKNLSPSFSSYAPGNSVVHSLRRRIVE